MISLIISILLSSANAAQPPDFYCKPSHAWDRGYDVTMVRGDNGIYTGKLNALSFLGRSTRYRGEVKIAMLSPSPNCAIRIESLNGSFAMQISEGGEIRLTQVSGGAVDEVDSVLTCEMSQAFVEDLRRFCQSGG